MLDDAAPDSFTYSVTRGFIPLVPHHDADSQHFAGKHRLIPDDFTPPLRTHLLILQPTPFCNLDCAYCYLPGRDEPRRITSGTVRAAARRLAEDGLVGPKLTVVWHSGEPLAVPVSLYRDAFAALDNELGALTCLTHAIQTNGTLIDDDWCDLFDAFQVRVGVSIDGPQPVHDAFRKTRTGRGTFGAVMHGIDCLRQRRIPFHAIAVVTERSVRDPDAFFDFFASLGVSELCINFEEAEGVHATSTLAGLERAQSEFMERLLSRMIGSGGVPRIRELASAIELIGDGLPTVNHRGRDYPENIQTIPFAMVNVKWNGDFSTFSPELLGQRSDAYRDFLLGNVFDGSYLDATSTDTFYRLHQDILRGIEACRSSCEFFPYCGGGAPANKFFEGGTFHGTETLYCRLGLKSPFNAILTRLERGLGT